MLKKSFLLFGTTFLFFVGCSLMLQSCRCEIKVCAFSVSVHWDSNMDSLNRVQDDGIDTCLNQMTFSYLVYNEPNNPACAWNALRFNRAYAFTRRCTIENPIIPESYFVMLNRDIQFNNETIAAGTNLIKHPSLRDHWEHDSFEEGYSRGGEIQGSFRLDSIAFNQLQFDTSIYDVAFGFATEDVQNMQDTLRVVYKL